MPLCRRSIAVSHCGSPDPKFRPYWVMGTCQLDMNPANASQYARLLSHFEAFYAIVNNADGFGLIDADPGGWPVNARSEYKRVLKYLSRRGVFGYPPEH